MANTEKPATKAQQKKVSNKVVTPKKEKIITPMKKEEKKEEIKTEEKIEEKKPVKKQEAPKKEEVVANGIGLPISTKKSKEVCRYIRGKRVEDAMEDMINVQKLKKVIPMRGEYAHKKGKGISGGKFPVNEAKSFYNLLKNLLGNARNHGIENPVISEAIANQGSKPFARFGKWERKRTHVMLKAKELKVKEKKK